MSAATIAPSRPLESLNEEATAPQGEMILALVPAIQAAFSAIDSAAAARELTDERLDSIFNTVARTHFGHLNHPARTYLAAFAATAAPDVIESALTMLAKALSEPWPSLST